MIEQPSAPIETVTTEEQEMLATGLDGHQHKVMATVTKTDHGTFDENGIPKISVQINVPSVPMGLTTGKVK